MDVEQDVLVIVHLLVYCSVDWPLLVSVVDAMDVVDLSVPFQSERDAEIAFEALRVDAEPKRGGVEKKVSIEGNILKVHFR